MTLLIAYRSAMKGEQEGIDAMLRMYRIWFRANKEEGFKEIPSVDIKSDRFWRRTIYMMFSRLGGNLDLASECI